MKRDYPSRPIIGILAVVCRGQRFLLVRRRREPNQGFWGFPGGVQELGETVIEAAERELAEETGVVAVDPVVLDAFDVIDRDAANAVRYHYTLIAVLMTWREGEGEAADDADAAGWFGLEDLSDLAVLPAVGSLMVAALRQRSGMTPNS